MLTSTDRAVAWRVPQDHSGPPMGGAGKHVSAGASPWQALLAETTSSAPTAKTGAAIKIASRYDWPAMGFVPAKSSTAAQQMGAPTSAQRMDIPAKGWTPNVDKGEIRPPFVPPKADTVVADASGKIPVDDDEAALAATETEKPAETKSEEGFSLFGKDGPSFGDIVDIINPFQHIPLLSNIYRDMLGDTISPAARIAGSALFFGPIGAAFAVANVALQGATGKDAGDHMVAFMKEHGTPAETAVADAGAASKPDISPDISDAKAETIPEATMETAAGATPAPVAVASLLPPGATPIEGRSVEFKAEALRPIGFAGPAAAPTAPFQQLIQDIKAGGAPLSADADTKIVPPSPKKAAAAYAALKADAASASIANPRPGTVADAPRPAPRATKDTVAPGATANGGGWFTDAMLSALRKYEATDKPASKPTAPSTPNAAIDIED